MAYNTVVATIFTLVVVQSVAPVDAKLKTILFRDSGMGDFQLSYADYKTGFYQGQVGRDFFVGLDAIRENIANGLTSLKIVLRDTRSGDQHTATYGFFNVGPEPDYVLTVANFSSRTLQDSLSASNGAKFYAKDRTDPWNCANQTKAGWWYNSNPNCAQALLTGKYYDPPGEYNLTTAMFDGLFWEGFRCRNFSLAHVAVYQFSELAPSTQSPATTQQAAITEAAPTQTATTTKTATTHQPSTAQPATTEKSATTAAPSIAPTSPGPRPAPTTAHPPKPSSQSRSAVSGLGVVSGVLAAAVLLRYGILKQ